MFDYFYLWSIDKTFSPDSDFTIAWFWLHGGRHCNDDHGDYHHDRGGGSNGNGHDDFGGDGGDGDDGDGGDDDGNDDGGGDGDENSAGGASE